jgi:Protein of unknown function (DUF2946)
MSSHRNLLLAWLAVAATALAPVLAYAQIQVGAHGEILEHCAVEKAGDTPAQHDHPNPDEGTAPHCPYCPGFSAGAALSHGVPSPATPGVFVVARVHLPQSVPAGRSSVRIAQPRAPPVSA